MTLISTFIWSLAHNIRRKPMNFPQQFSKVTLTLLLVILGAGAALAQTKKAIRTVTPADDQVAFTATGTYTGTISKPNLN
jgi:hypothetical protein